MTVDAYVDETGLAVDWDTAVVDNVTTVAIYRIPAGDFRRRELFAAAGQPLSTATIAAARLTSTTPAASAPAGGDLYLNNGSLQYVDANGRVTVLSD